MKVVRQPVWLDRILGLNSFLGLHSPHVIWKRGFLNFSANPSDVKCQQNMLELLDNSEPGIVNMRKNKGLQIAHRLLLSFPHPGHREEV